MPHITTLAGTHREHPEHPRHPDLAGVAVERIGADLGQILAFLRVVTHQAIAGAWFGVNETWTTTKGPTMATPLRDKKVAFLVAPEGVEQVELTEPWHAVTSAGGVPSLVSTALGKVEAFHHLDRADTFDIDAIVGRVSAADFDGLVLPGGVANPDYLRTQPAAVDFARGFFDAGKPVAVICHGPWTLVEAGVLIGRTLTSWRSLRTDIVNAGGTWVDEPVVVCTDQPSTLVSSRKPADLPAFCTRLVEVFEGEPAGG